MLTAKGSYFFYTNTGAQFFMRGIHYQDFRDDFRNSSSYIDPLEDGAKCARDIPYLKALGINTLYVVFIRLDAVHSSCMTKLRDAGIYVLVHLGGNGEEDNVTGKWDYPLQRRCTTILNSLGRFPNVLGFWIMSDAQSLPFTKAAVRDLKAYLQVSGHRAIPVGYAVEFEGFPLSNFLSCGEQSVSVDFLFYYLGGFCLDISRIREELEQLISVPVHVPSFVINNPCNTATQADSKILVSAYSDNYTAVHSGAVFFSYFDARSSASTRAGRHRSLIQLRLIDYS
jgi:1,3-beta-glucanosyltransferase GAS1